MLPDTGISHYIATPWDQFTYTAAASGAAAATMAANTPMEDGGGRNYFDFSDNVYIESLYVAMTYQFGLALPQPASAQYVIRLGWLDKSTNAGNLLEFGSNGDFLVNDAPLEIPVNTLIKRPATADNDWLIRVVQASGFQINCFNTPTALVSSTQYLSVMLKVRHTLDMVT